jgi:hypothetical protein
LDKIPEANLWLEGILRVIRIDDRAESVQNFRIKPFPLADVVAVRRT